MANTHEDRVRDVLQECGEFTIKSYAGQREWTLEYRSGLYRLTIQNGHETAPVSLTSINIEVAFEALHNFIMA
jgi:hypothetical protein